MNNYFVFSTKGTQEGPFSHDELEQLVKNGTYGAGSQVWQGEENGWEPIEKHFPLPQTSAPLPVALPPVPTSTDLPPIPASSLPPVPAQQSNVPQTTTKNNSAAPKKGFKIPKITWAAISPFLLLGLWIAKYYHKEYQKKAAYEKVIRKRPVPKLQQMNNSNSQYGNYNNNQYNNYSYQQQYAPSNTGGYYSDTDTYYY